ncbi:MAG: signal peptidase I [Nocardioidaceae bacterium]
MTSASGGDDSISAPDNRPPSPLGSSAAPAAADEKKSMPAWQEMILLVATAIVLALVIKTFLLQAFYIPSVSMRTTLEVDDRILVEKVSDWFGDVERGDMVVFDDPAQWLGPGGGQEPGNALTKTLSVIGLYPTGGHLVKRVIGIGGDTVACVEGTVEVNGVALDESDYVTLPRQACADTFNVKVPADHIWVMGDNREQSGDSRAHLGDPGGGFIPVDDIVGKVFVTVWPLDRWQFFDRPETLDNAAQTSAVLLLDSAPLGMAVLAPIVIRRRRRSRAPAGSR